MLAMRHLRQPKTLIELKDALESIALKRLIFEHMGDKLLLCGQCCVAMVANTTLQEAIIACAAGGATTIESLVDGLRLLDVECAVMPCDVNRLPYFCIVQSVGNDASHWMVKKGEALYDPEETTVKPFRIERVNGDKLICVAE
jgi:hypothetical protein